MSANGPKGLQHLEICSTKSNPRVSLEVLHMVVHEPWIHGDKIDLFDGGFRKVIWLPKLN